MNDEMNDHVQVLSQDVIRHMISLILNVVL